MKLRRLECYDEQLSHIGKIEDKIVEVFIYFIFFFLNFNFLKDRKFLFYELPWKNVWNLFAKMFSKSEQLQFNYSRLF